MPNAPSEMGPEKVPRTERDYIKEDREAAQSEVTGKIPKSEVEELRESAGEDLNVSGRTRGKKIDAYKAERAVDEAVQREME